MIPLRSNPPAHQVRHGAMRIMPFSQKIWIGILLVGTAGCGVQDPTQPPVGSISVGARRDDSMPNLPPGKAKAGPAGRR
jgi:hypothetical protein